MDSNQPNEKFWLNDPRVLIANLRVLPTSEMTNTEKLNALTRLLLVATLGMALLCYKHYF